MHRSLCVCAFIPSPRIATETEVVVIMHRFEARKSTNTGLLALECLARSRLITRGHRVERETPLDLAGSTRQPVYLFPHEDAVPISEFVGRSVTLIVPDATWRQASKVRRRVPGLESIPCARIPFESPSTYRLRSAPKHDSLSTIEAIARALGELEGGAVRHALENVFRVMVERTLMSRGLQAR